MIGLSAQVLPEDLPVVLKLVPSSLRTPSLPLISVPKPKTASARPGARLRNGSGTGRSRFCPQTREGLTTCWCSRNPWACADGLHRREQPQRSRLLHRVPDAATEAMEGFGVATAPRSRCARARNPVHFNQVGPRDRSAWKIKEAAQALETASSLLPEVLR